MKIVSIKKTDFEVNEFPKNTEFAFKNDLFKIAFTDPEEIRMGYYIRSVKVFKNNQLHKSFDCADPSYFSVSSPDNKYLALPTGNGIELTNLETGDSAAFDIYFLIGIEFDQNSRFCIINGQNESKLIDLEQLNIIFKYKDPENHISQCRFGSDNRLWTIEKWGLKFRIEMLDCSSLTSEYHIIDTPFEFFKISKQEYEPLIESNRHCVWITPNGGMRWSGFLNKWEYVPCKSGIIYKTLIPKTGVSFSKNYNVNSCEADFGYIEIRMDTNNNEDIVSKLKRLFN